AFDGAGNLLIVWESRRQEQATPGVFAQLLDPLGRPLTTELHVNQFLPGGQGRPAAAFGPDGSAWIVWESGGQDGSGLGIYARRFGFRTQAGPGRSFGALSDEIRFSPTTRGDQQAASVSISFTGQVLVTWISSGADRRVAMGRLFDSKMNPATDEFRLSVSDSGDESVASGAWLSASRFVAVWSGSKGMGRPSAVMARFFDASGNPAAGPLQVSTPERSQNIEPALAVDGKGGLLVAWLNSGRHEHGFRVLARGLTSAGEPLGPPVEIVPAGGEWNSGVAVTPAFRNGFLVAFNRVGRKDPRALTPRPTAEAAVWARPVDAAGRASGDAVRINGFDQGSQMLTVGSSASRAARGSRGSLAFTWNGRVDGGEKHGVGLTLLVPRSLALAAPPALEPRAALVTPADFEQSLSRAHARPEYDPNYVPDPPEANAPPAGPDFGFQASANTGWNPPDPDLAVGPANIVTIVNGEIAFFDKAGNNSFRQAIAGSSGFWGSVGAENFVFDPTALYDPHSGRFIVGAGEQASNGGQLLVLAVSDDSDPNGTWFKYRFDLTAVGGFVDFPNLGVDQDAVYFVNDFFAAPTGNFIHIIPKAPLLVGGAATVTSVRTASGPISLSSTKTYDTSTPAQYFITAFSGSNTKLLLKAIENPLGTPVLSQFQLTVPSFNGPPDADQFGTSNLADTIDFRIKNGIYRNGRLWVAHTVGVNGTARVRWYEIDPRGWPASGNNPVLVQMGTQNLGVGEHNWYGDINVDAAGNMALAFNRSSSNQYISVERSFHLAGDSAGSLHSPTLLQISTSPEEGSRWGDYSGLEEDPVSPGTFWSHHEYRTSSWRTWVGKFTPMAAPETDTILLTGPTSVNVHGFVIYDWSKAPPSSPWFMLLSKKLGGTTINGQPFDIGPAVRIMGTGTTSPAGTGSWVGGPARAKFSGKTFHLELRVDSNGQTFDSNAISLTVN
ncbi:MAG: hypothetical protein ACE5H3_08950, partial [Planctomycetota bacterium]